MKNVCKVALGLAVWAGFLACTPSERQVPLAESFFDSAASDPAAIQIADSMADAAGGINAWHEIRFLQWQADDVIYTWDKQRHRVRAVYPGFTGLLDLASGSVKIEPPPTDADAAQRHVLQRWHLDRFSLALPFELKRGGRVLKYLGVDPLLEEKEFNVIEVTFRDDAFGRGRYRLWVDMQTKYIYRCDYFPLLDGPRLYSTTFDHYRSLGTILLSTDRADGEGPRQVQILTDVSDNVFTRF